jgi:hypothetical protein
MGVAELRDGKMLPACACEPNKRRNTTKIMCCIWPEVVDNHHFKLSVRSGSPSDHFPSRPQV